MFRGEDGMTFLKATHLVSDREKHTLSHALVTAHVTRERASHEHMHATNFFGVCAHATRVFQHVEAD